MLANSAHCTARSVFKALIIEMSFSLEVAFILQIILRLIPLGQYSFLSINGNVQIGSAPLAPGAFAKISETTPDFFHSSNRAHSAWYKTSHPRPAPAATRDRESSPAPHQMCTLRSGRPVAPSP